MSELQEVRGDIKQLIATVSQLKQKVDDLNLHSPPCSILDNHIKVTHKNTTIEAIKKQVINVITSVVIIGLLGYLYLGFKAEAKEQNKTPQAINKGP